jgi:hypothetical protein
MRARRLREGTEVVGDPSTRSTGFVRGRHNVATPRNLAKSVTVE